MAAIKELAAFVPPEVVTTESVASRLAIESDDAVRKTGVLVRSWSKDRSLLSLAVSAVANLDMDEPPDFLIFVTDTAPRSSPAMAPELVTKLGLGEIPAVDVKAVCSGAIYALQLAASLADAGIYKRILVVAAEKYSDYLGGDDPGPYLIFGDGAACAMVESRGGLELRKWNLGSDGSKHELIGRSSDPRSRIATELPSRSRDYFSMSGREVFVNASRRMGEAITTLADDEGWAPAEIDFLVPHQANQRILDQVGRLLRIPQDCMASNIERVGNTGAASVLIALSEHPGRAVNRGIMVAFGGGLTWGAVSFSGVIPSSLNIIHEGV